MGISHAELSPAFSQDELTAITSGDQDSELMSACRHILAYGGKQLRPRVVFAAAHLGVDPYSDDIRRAALAIELVHSASLAHDDLIDDSSLRRGHRTVGAEFGNRVAGLAGGWLCGTAGLLIAGCGDVALERLSDGACQVWEGQTIELCDLYDRERSVERYFEAIGGKTAALFALGTVVGAELAGASEETVERAHDYGWNLGLAFQILDDLHDLLLDEKATGKPQGQDLMHGIYTLPVLYALEEDAADDGSLAALLSGDDTAAVTAAVTATRGPARAIATAQRHAVGASAAVAGLDDAEPLLELLDEAVSTPLGELL